MTPNKAEGIRKVTSNDRTEALAGASVGIIINALLLWWLVWSILDLIHGNPATWWNILGIIVGGQNILGNAISRSKK